MTSSNIKKENSNTDTDYTLRPATLEDACEIWTVMNCVSQTMEHKEYFICDDLEYVKDILTGHGFGVVACDPDGTIVGNLLVKYPGLEEENLGYDIFVKYDNNSTQDIFSNSDNSSLLISSDNYNNCRNYNIALTSENLECVVHMDSSSVLPEHQGHHLESRMIAFAEILIDTSKYHYSFATVAPENVASLKSLVHNGYQIMVTKEKYGGVMRCVVMKELI